MRPPRATTGEPAARLRRARRSALALALLACLLFAPACGLKAPPQPLHPDRATLIPSAADDDDADEEGDETGGAATDEAGGTAGDEAKPQTDTQPTDEQPEDDSEDDSPAEDPGTE